jgi:hypothetical protein
MMTPKEKAKELVDKMYWHFRTIADSDICKQCALIAVDEIIKEHYPQDIKRCEYWQEVKQEIEKL